MRKQLPLGLILVLLLLLSGCRLSLAGVSGPCDQIVENALLDIPFETLDLQRMRQWIQNSYQLEFTDIHNYTHPSSEARESLSWRWQGKEYWATLHYDGDLRNIRMVWEAAHPTAEQILECFGPPDFYQASYQLVPPGTNLFNLGLWYFDKGLVVGSSSQSQSTQPPAIQPNLVMTYVFVAPPGVAEEVLADVYFPSPESSIQKTEQALQPWPGRLEDIQVDVDLRPLNDSGS